MASDEGRCARPVSSHRSGCGGLRVYWSDWAGNRAAPGASVSRRRCWKRASGRPGQSGPRHSGGPGADWIETPGGYETEAARGIAAPAKSGSEDQHAIAVAEEAIFGFNGMTIGV